MTKRIAAFVLVSTNDGTMIVNRFDTRTVGDDTWGIGAEILRYSRYDPAETKEIATVMQLRQAHHGDGVMVVDCGANIGALTVQWAKVLTGGGRIIAIEPQERLFYALCGNIALNNCLNAFAIHAAVGASNGKIRVPVLDYEKAASFGSLELHPVKEYEDIGQPVDYAKTQDVRLLSIDSLRLARLDVLKIDVEGMELEVLEGARDTIKCCRPVILAEHLKIGKDALAVALRALGYTELLPMGLNTLAIHPADPIRGAITVEEKAA